MFVMSWRYPYQIMLSGVKSTSVKEYSLMSLSMKPLQRPWTMNEGIVSLLFTLYNWRDGRGIDKTNGFHSAHHSIITVNKGGHYMVKKIADITTIRAHLWASIRQFYQKRSTSTAFNLGDVPFYSIMVSSLQS